MLIPRELKNSQISIFPTAHILKNECVFFWNQSPEHCNSGHSWPAPQLLQDKKTEENKWSKNPGKYQVVCFIKPSFYIVVADPFLHIINYSPAKKVEHAKSYGVLNGS